MPCKPSCNSCRPRRLETACPGPYRPCRCLTEDQGWRIEIRKYPLLTTVGAWRKETLVGHPSSSQTYDHRPHGGFYTQDEVRQVVAYATARGITVVPEIELPGHAQAASSGANTCRTGDRSSTWPSRARWRWPKCCGVQKAARNWAGFQRRLPGQLAWLDRAGVNYRPLDPPLTSGSSALP
jgi:hypothetical protein